MRPSQARTATRGKRPPAFTGGTIHKVIIDVADDPRVDPDKEAEAAFRSQQAAGRPAGRQ